MEKILSYTELVIRYKEFREDTPKYGLHKLGDICKITSWSTLIKPKELHFKYKGKAEWAFLSDFLYFSNSKRLLRKKGKQLHT